MPKQSKRWLYLSSAALAVSLIASGCSSDPSSDSSDDAVDASVLGPENKATGEPIKFALTWPGEKAPVNQPELQSANAAIGYINNHLGGVNGRPLELAIECGNELQVSIARDCANKFVQSEAVALVSGSEGNSDTIAGITSPAGLPYVAVAGGKETTKLPNTFIAANALSVSSGAAAYYAQEQGFDEVAVMTVDVPTALEPLKALGSIVYGNAGATPEITTVPLGTADMTPQIQAALQNDPDMFALLGDTSFCAAALKAMRTLNASQPVTANSQCVGDKSLAPQIPGGFKDVIVGAAWSLDPNAEETKIYRAALAEYGDGGAENGAASYQAVLALARSLEGMAGEITRETVSARLSNMPSAQLLPLGAGATFQCGTHPVQVAPNICTAQGLIGRAEEDGTVVDVRAVDQSALFKLPTS